MNRRRLRFQSSWLRHLTAALLLSALVVPTWAAESEVAEWPFVAPKRSAIPRVQRKSWVRNPIDAFVLASLEKAGLRPNAPADKLTLLRRVTFDLTGLLPTPAEREAFLADKAPDAYERLVDRLLRSPHFGERWAQHWLDVVRYAETAGFKIDRQRPDAYRYRDYVIRACNNDLPYDRFLRQQLAGCELEPNNPDALIATGFYRLPVEETNGSNYRMVRQEILDDITDVFSSSVLGLTIGCARCHDHKFDPISQSDYYRLQAFFTPLMQRDDLILASAAEQSRYQHQLVKWEEATRELRAQRDALVAGHKKAIVAELTLTFDAETQHALALPAQKRTPLEHQLAALAEKQLERNRRSRRPYRRLSKEKRAVYDDLRKKIAAFDGIKPEPLPIAMGATSMSGEPPATHRLKTGNYRKPREQVQSGFPECCCPTSATVPRAAKSNRGLRAVDLARWLGRPDHPLTSRVMVNRLWQHHLGVGIVATPNDFGVMGDKPTHPELLDYLATELVRQGWKLKALHRLIVTSATYRQASSLGRNPTATKAGQVDPSNKLLWHARIKRREAEAIRDAILQVSGRLNPRMHGPSNCPELSAVVAGYDYAWEPDERLVDRDRRSIYVLAKRNFAYPLFAAFDQPDRVNSCPLRATTITAPQALTMLNGEFTLKQARYWSGVLLAAHGRDTGALIRAAYRQVYGREADRDEIALAGKFLQRQAGVIASKGDPGRDAQPEPKPHGIDSAFAAAVVDFCHALLNSAEFLDVE